MQDDGPGVHSEDIDKIFSADVKATKNQKAGHGVGLNLSRKLAAYMGGELRYISNSTGAEFQLDAKFDVAVKVVQPKQVNYSLN